MNHVIIELFKCNLLCQSFERDVCNEHVEIKLYIDGSCVC